MDMCWSVCCTTQQVGIQSISHPMRESQASRLNVSDQIYLLEDWSPQRDLRDAVWDGRKRWAKPSNSLETEYGRQVAELGPPTASALIFRRLLYNEQLQVLLRRVSGRHDMSVSSASVSKSTCGRISSHTCFRGQHTVGQSDTVSAARESANIDGPVLQVGSPCSPRLGIVVTLSSGQGIPQNHVSCHSCIAGKANPVRTRGQRTARRDCSTCCAIAHDEAIPCHK
ncbi:uncharacterized protein C8Q71DRAFT_284523 [Rhodofomes roseus]|uniref:Uncharacterized protein n=1 Tax=Rhodofomes roseus TaxID=34475 RepID=A0ABQ8K4I6_9APHY|nr:uncharacterized protein C8Q71DRAFT_284523 [Rhodofomes roseus]KAH9831767.1 hypothetical protein C8Q71DRAFT_284523 [Rhodofomes roseus]